MMQKLKHILFFLFITVISFVKSQEVKVNAVLDSSKIRIGEQTKLDVYLTYDANAEKNLKIEWPSFEDTISGHIEIVSRTSIDSTIPDKNNPGIIQQHQQFIITSFDSGSYYIPSFKFVLNGDTSHPSMTEPLLLEVNTVAVDTSAASIKDIKAPFEEPFDWKWYLPYAYWGLGIVGVLSILIYIFYRLTRKKPEVVEVAKPKIPAHITALASLQKIREEALWKENKTKEYYSAISDAVRLYIEERFEVNALELTTDEIVKAFRSQVVDPVSKEKLQKLLVLSDFVKFAKVIPLEQEHLLALQNAFDFVNGTKREEVVTIIEDPIAETSGSIENTEANKEEETK